MMMILKPVKEFVQKWKRFLKEYIIARELKPRLAIIQVGSNEASSRYVRNKLKDCEEIGIDGELYVYPEDIKEEELLEEIGKLNDDETVNGIIVQLPLPEGIDESKIAASINVKKDVDGFRKESAFQPCTPLGIMKYLEHCGFGFEGAEAVVIGRSNIVGKPMAQMLTDAGCTVVLTHSKTKHLFDFIRRADLIVCAVGKKNFLNCYPIREDQIVVDVGINFDKDGKMVGDCFNTENRNVTPVPGGVGLLTRVALMDNVVKAVERNVNT